ncbi:uncharacterized protein LOC113521090 isoform X2 [Galleria mellonella]|uniref:Uncharacterized protein LOC113521090 isoform X2 n=1 Tax=Galleria mellonella TaxID=7137 RepID=A0ABM3MTX5_GALME|nr:uncharacterized protein LOC113521090 isoform X2 [Galleria mellonella]
MRSQTILFVGIVSLCSAKEYYDKLDRYLIACHTTDFVCFKRQYKALRDNVLLGNNILNIDYYDPYYFKYGNSGTCIKLSGLEESELVGISMDGAVGLFGLTLELPLRVQQVYNDTKLCAEPEREFTSVQTHNATIQAIYPYEIRKKKGVIHMVLEEEDLEVILDIPHLIDYDMNNTEQLAVYNLSEWAYDILQHIDAAKSFALPYTSQYRTLAERVSIERLLLLYPEEEYTDVKFNFSDSYHFP